MLVYEKKWEKIVTDPKLVVWVCVCVCVCVFIYTYTFV